ncbi:hypothetical protein ACFX5K_01255 [Rickettsiales bacterium LUAb2]
MNVIETVKAVRNCKCEDCNKSADYLISWIDVRGRLDYVIMCEECAVDNRYIEAEEEEACSFYDIHREQIEAFNSIAGTNYYTGRF